MSVKFYENSYAHRGAGFGGFFKGLFNILRPIVTSPITKSIGKELLSTGARIGADVLSGDKSFKDSASQNLQVAKKKVADTVRSALDSDGESESEEESPPPSQFKKPIKRGRVSFNTVNKRRKIVI